MKYMSVYLSFLVIFGSLTFINSFTAPNYEDPVIVKPKDLKGNQPKGALSADKLKISLNKVDLKAEKQTLRNNLVRDFNFKNLEKWINHLENEKVDKLSNDESIDNLNNVKILSIEMQKNIHKTSGNISELLKLLHLKLKEVDAVKQKIKSLTNTSSKNKLKEIESKTDKLESSLKKEMNKVDQIMKNLQIKQNKMIQSLAIYDKNFVKRNKNKIKDLLNAINLKLKSEMSLPYFNTAYSKFASFVLTLSKDFTPAQLENAQSTASEVSNKHWRKYLDEAKSEWEKVQPKEKKKSGNKVEKMKGKRRF